MSLRGILIGGSLLAHAGLLIALGAIKAPEAITATSIEVIETKKPEAPPPPPAKVEPPPPPPEPAARARPAKPAPPAPAEPEAAPAPGLANLPDFGLELGGGGGGPGLAVPRGVEGAAPKPTAPVAKTLQAAPPPKPADTCAEGPAKPKLLNLPKPEYTEAARSAGIEGKVRVELTVDETGKVVEVRALTSLGHGLDEAALAAAKAATFDPALRCGRPSRSTFTISIRFSAS